MEMTRFLRLAMWRYSIDPRTKKYGKGYGILSFVRKYKKQLLDTGLDALKTASKKLVHKTGDFLGDKFTDAVAKSSEDKILKPEHVINENPRNVEEKIIPPEKRDEILNELRQVL